MGPRESRDDGLGPSTLRGNTNMLPNDPVEPCSKDILDSYGEQRYSKISKSQSFPDRGQTTWPPAPSSEASSLTILDDPSAIFSAHCGTSTVGLQDIVETNLKPREFDQTWIFNSIPTVLSPGNSEPGVFVGECPGQISSATSAPLIIPTEQQHPVVCRETSQHSRMRAKFRYRTATKEIHTYICEYGRCNKSFSRIYDLRRHHEGIHEKRAIFPCGWAGCRRNVKAFTRKDKRDEHERKIHGHVSGKRDGGNGEIGELEFAMMGDGMLV